MPGCRRGPRAMGMRGILTVSGARNCAGEGGRDRVAPGSPDGPRSGSPCGARNRSPDRAHATRVMKASRAVLARIDAALISPTRASPPITASKSQSRPSMPRSGQRLPSTQTRPGATASPRIARRIASSEASRMFNTSISAASTQPMAQALACQPDSRAPVVRAPRGVSCLESRRPAMGRRGSRITAAATTGPARGPRPASSTPAVRPPARPRPCHGQAAHAGRLAGERQDRLGGPPARALPELPVDGRKQGRAARRPPRARRASARFRGPAARGGHRPGRAPARPSGPPAGSVAQRTAPSASPRCRSANAVSAPRR